jgi:hypothetical protein
MAKEMEKEPGVIEDMTKIIMKKPKKSKQENTTSPSKK